MKKQIKIRKEKEIRESDERMAKLIARDEERRKRFEEETNTFAVGGRKTRKNRKSKKLRIST